MGKAGEDKYMECDFNQSFSVEVCNNPQKEANNKPANRGWMSNKATISYQIRVAFIFQPSTSIQLDNEKLC